MLSGLVFPVRVSERQKTVYSTDCNVSSVLIFPQMVLRNVITDCGRLLVDGRYAQELAFQPLFTAFTRQDTRRCYPSLDQLDLYSNTT